MNLSMICQVFPNDNYIQNSSTDNKRGSAELLGPVLRFNVCFIGARMLFSGQCMALLSPSVFYKSPDSGGSEAEEGDSQGAPIAPKNEARGDRGWGRLKTGRCRREYLL